MKAFILILLAVLFFSNSVFSEESKQKGNKSALRSWKLEPESLLGVKLGAPLDEHIKECPKIKVGTGDSAFESSLGYQTVTYKCWEKNKYTQNEFQIHNVPKLGMGESTVFAMEVDGLVGSVFFYFNSSDSDRMEALLVSKYGKPTKDYFLTKQNKMGAKFSSHQMVWSGKVVTLSLESISGQIDRGLVNMFTRKYSESVRFDPDLYKDKL